MWKSLSEVGLRMGMEHSDKKLALNQKLRNPNLISKLIELLHGQTDGLSDTVRSTRLVIQIKNICILRIYTLTEIVLPFARL